MRQENRVPNFQHLLLQPTSLKELLDLTLLIPLLLFLSFYSTIAFLVSSCLPSKSQSLFLQPHAPAPSMFKFSKFPPLCSCFSKLACSSWAHLSTAIASISEGDRKRNNNIKCSRRFTKDGDSPKTLAEEEL